MGDSPKKKTIRFGDANDTIRFDLGKDFRNGTPPKLPIMLGQHAL